MFCGTLYVNLQKRMFSAATVFVLMCVTSFCLSDKKLRCYRCITAHSLSNCTIKTCEPPYNHCYYEEMRSRSGFHIYGGCTTDSICRPLGGQGLIYNTPLRQACKKCCVGDLCNKQLCSLSITGPVQHHTTHQPVTTPPVGPRCFACHGVDSVFGCNGMSGCSIGDQCSMDVYDVGENQIRYYGACRNTSRCTAHSHPARPGHNICSECCTEDFCNSEVCGAQVEAYTTGISTGERRRQCYQCYDQKLGEINQCYKKVECAHSSSQCSQVIRNESGIATVDMDCEENLPCTSTVGTDHDVCDICCNWDFCNREVDCRYQSTAAIHISPRNHTGVECEVCSGAECGVDSRRAVSIRCNNTTPYCLNTVLNDVNGDKHVTKMCGSLSACESKWLQKSSLLDVCLNFDPSNIYSHSFECTYCCVTHNCNRNIRPQNNTLYNPGFYLP